ncbi:NADH-quinone oxidoreductase subunit L [Candidatus Comchoanobacter bicostacola]|uniref:NADH-quinone oxidoreductase subunit L n=1 Tax=Candidatus Comchoanobacter bicostacola TaxID=2919598 RepID=A0ABY5DKH8_9GAMM|nr:NADH-quinone oxidoreductase subunit L [Candidatus Comchoanobacter bicostacola]UTC24794.1 NADH-quinone oxidoreductase subunit L [Candidatus Comchoanobacter bicostacola]
MTLLFWTWTCLLAPTISAVLARVWAVRDACWINILGMLVSWVASVVLYIQQPNTFINFYVYTWLDVGDAFNFGFWLDALSVYMAVIITLVSLFVHIYSVSYMRGDKDINNYFFYVSLFTSAMLLLILADNLLMVFFGWELVGVFSYFLIGFWYQKSYPLEASFKAFIVNRVADIGLMIAMGLLLYQLGSLSYMDLTVSQPILLEGLVANYRWVDLISLMLLIGAMGKSAQMPLHVWLPDSMAGPTPISALIHAATMVTAGVYLIARLSFIFALSPLVCSGIVILGLLQMFLMGGLALVEFDIKRVVAFSTLSQLGLMFAACGAAGFIPAIYHLGTHAFFKSLLFLSAGAIIIASNHEQDIRYTASARYYWPIHGSLLVGCLSLSGMPPFSGFFSKDMILTTLNSQITQYWYLNFLMIMGVLMTALYSARFYFMLCWTPKRERIKTLDWQMKGPLLVLAFLSIAFGAGAYQEVFLLNNALIDTLQRLSMNDFIIESFSHPYIYMVFLGWAVSGLAYVYCPQIPSQVVERIPMIYQICRKQYGFDIFYQNYIVSAYQSISFIFAKVIDRYVIDQTILVNGSSLCLRLLSNFRVIQSGYIYEYVLGLFLAVIVLLVGLF